MLERTLSSMLSYSVIVFLPELQSRFYYFLLLYETFLIIYYEMTDVNPLDLDASLFAHNLKYRYQVYLSGHSDVCSLQAGLTRTHMWGQHFIPPFFSVIFSLSIEVVFSLFVFCHFPSINTISSLNSQLISAIIIMISNIPSPP